MLYNPFLLSSADEREAAPALVLPSPTVRPGREPLRHILLGSEARVNAAVQQLHVLRYAEQFTWSEAILVPPTGITITPNQGDVMRYLVRWRKVETALGD